MNVKQVIICSWISRDYESYVLYIRQNYRGLAARVKCIAFIIVITIALHFSVFFFSFAKQNMAFDVNIAYVLCYFWPELSTIYEAKKANWNLKKTGFGDSIYFMWQTSRQILTYNITWVNRSTLEWINCRFFLCFSWNF